MGKKNKRARILCLTNQKGGVGKTCSTCNLGAAFTKRGNTVLLIDMDPQANLSVSLGVEDPEISIYNSLVEGVSLQDAVYPIAERLHLVPSSIDLAGAEIELASEAGKDLILKEALEPVIYSYDYILLDCQPSLGLLTLNSLAAADEVYIPLQAQYLSLRGIVKLKDTIQKVKNRLNKNLSIGGVFVTQYDGRKVSNREIAEAIEEQYSKEALRTRIRDTVALAEATGNHKDIFRYKPKSYGAEDYLKLGDEIISRNKIGK